MNKQTVEVISVSEERRRRWSAEEKAALVRQTYEPGMSVSLVARQSGVAASFLFNCQRPTGPRTDAYLIMRHPVAHFYFARNNTRAVISKRPQ